MACSQTLKNETFDCLGNAGGVKEIFVCNAGLSAVAASFATNAANNTFAATATPLTTGTLFRYAMPRGAASFGTTAVINRETGANYFDNTLAVALNKLTDDGVKAVLLKAFALGAFTVFVRDNNDVVHLMGFTGEGAMATDGSSTTGAALTDRNGENITLVASEAQPAWTAAWSSVASAILAGV